MAAFELALEHGCDGFEFDVRLTVDRVPVVCHDPKLCGLSVAQSSYETLLEVAARKGKEIARLEQVLEFGPRAFLNLELKVGGAEELVIQMLRKYPATQRLIVSSFLRSVILKLHELNAEFPLGIICENRTQLATWKELPVRAVMVNRALLTADLVTELKSAGRQAFVWTVNNSREMLKFAAMGVDGIISDDTKLLVQTVKP
jgi:glycerophosphoryl diester phosphodiesterase